MTSTGHQTPWSLSCVCVHLAKLTPEGMVSLRARFDNEEYLFIVKLRFSHSQAVQ